MVKQRPDTVHVDYIEGPLKSLTNDWQFLADGKGGCIVDFAVAFTFKSRMFEVLAGQFFDLALKRMVGAFEARAHTLYSAVQLGSSSSSATSTA